MGPDKQLTNRFVLIDDDPIYRAIILRAASLEEIEVDVYDSLLDIGSIEMLGRYDAAIVDYDLGRRNGVEIAEDLSRVFDHIPVILVSGQERVPGTKAWPANIKKFIKKSQGYGYALREASKAAYRQKEPLTHSLDILQRTNF